MCALDHPIYLDTPTVHTGLVTGGGRGGEEEGKGEREERRGEEEEQG